MTPVMRSAAIRRLAVPAWVLLLAFFFAHVEVEIEGPAGWAGALPTWRIEQHWLLDLFWGGRAMTGYHAWVFSFMFLMFHLPMVAASRRSWRDEARTLGAIMLFWIAEDFLWFLINPAYGIGGFNPQAARWHRHWLWFAPVEYWVFLPVAGLLYWLAAFNRSRTSPASAARNRVAGLR